MQGDTCGGVRGDSVAGFLSLTDNWSSSVMPCGVCGSEVNDVIWGSAGVLFDRGVKCDSEGEQCVLGSFSRRHMVARCVRFHEESGGL